jgi:hypothetical protein
MKRESTCICTEDCLVLELPYEIKREFFSKDYSKELENSLKWLKKIKTLEEELEEFYLMQIAYNVERKQYKYGEYLVKAGSIPIGMHIVIKGQCLAVYENIDVKKKDTDEFTKFKKQPKNF